MVTLVPSYLSLGELPLSGRETSGVEWIAESVDGWEGSPASTLTIAQKPRSGGGWAGDAFPVSRSMAISGLVFAPTPELLSDAIDRLNAAVSDYDALLVVSESGKSRWCMVRRAGDVLAASTDLSAKWSVQVVALDPRKLGDELTASTGLPSSSGGLTAPFTVPFSVNAVTNSGQVSLENVGNESGPVSLRIDGPCTGPVITHVGSGLALVFASSLVLGAGEWLTVDMEAKSVMANDQASRNTWVISRGWSNFAVGQNTWAFTAAAYSPDSRLTVTATPAWK